MKDTFTVLKKAVAKQKYIAFYFFEFLRELVPEFYIKRTDPNKRTYPISTCTILQRHFRAALKATLDWY